MMMMMMMMPGCEEARRPQEGSGGFRRVQRVQEGSGRSGRAPLGCRGAWVQARAAPDRRTGPRFGPVGQGEVAWLPAFTCLSLISRVLALVPSGQKGVRWDLVPSGRRRSSRSEGSEV